MGHAPLRHRKLCRTWVAVVPRGRQRIRSVAFRIKAPDRCNRHPMVLGHQMTVSPLVVAVGVVVDVVMMLVAVPNCLCDTYGPD